VDGVGTDADAAGLARDDAESAVDDEDCSDREPQPAMTNGAVRTIAAIQCGPVADLLAIVCGLLLLLSTTVLIL
jgi:hypothetical protein